MEKKKIVYTVLVVVAVTALSFSNLWFFMGNESLQNQVSNLEAQKASLQSQVSNLEVDKSQLQSQVSTLEADKSGLETQADSLNSQINSLSSQINALNSQVTTLQNDVSYGESEMDRLNDIIENLKIEADARDNEMYSRDREIDSLEAQISSLNYQVDDLRAPKLVNIGVGADDKRTEGSPSSLYVYGWVVNFGHDAADPAKLHVTAHFINGTIAIDTYINLGGIGGLCSRKLNYSIKYEGPSLDMPRVTITPEITDQ